MPSPTDPSPPSRDNASSITRLAQANQDLSFADLMIELRRRKGLSARKLSEVAGMSPSYISKMEKGEFLPAVDTFSNLVDALDCTDSEVIWLVRTLRRPDGKLSDL